MRRLSASDPCDYWRFAGFAVIAAFGAHLAKDDVRRRVLHQRSKAREIGSDRGLDAGFQAGFRVLCSLFRQLLLTKSPQPSDDS